MEPPDDAALSRSANLAYDKNWLTCDNGATSPFRGRCYSRTRSRGDEDVLAVQRSNDGGRTWSPQVTLRIPMTGVIPVVHPDGMLVLVFWSDRTGMVAVPIDRRRRHPRDPVTISDLRARGTRPLRAPTLIAAEVDAEGRVLAVWQDCRFNPGCTANDAVFARSTEGTTWSPPARVTSGRNVVMPTLGVEPGTDRTRSPTT